MIVGLNRFFYEFSVEIAPLHPDKAGGLRILGEYALTTGLFVGAIGLTFGMGVLRARLNPAVLAPEFYISMIVYFLMAPVLFFAPLIQAHSLMRKAKGALLAEVAEQFDLEYRKLLDGLRHDVLDPNEFTRVETIQKIYKIAEDAPEWPLDLGILSRFVAATVLPFLIPLGTDLFSRLFMH